MLGLWLMASPFIFRSSGSMVNEMLCGSLVLIFGFLSFWNRTRWAHFMILIVGLWLVISGYAAGHPAPPQSQNEIIVGLVLGMFAIIPNRANEIPAAWRKFYA